jgi:hypothetical protein
VNANLFEEAAFKSFQAYVCSLSKSLYRMLARLLWQKLRHLHQTGLMKLRLSAEQVASIKMVTKLNSSAFGTAKTNS